MNLATISVSDLMNSNVKTVNEDKNVTSACKVMDKNNIGCVILVTIATEHSTDRLIHILKRWSLSDKACAHD